jgi:hypothetical protein
LPCTSKELLGGGDALGELLDPVGVVGHVIIVPGLMLAAWRAR